MQSGVRAAEEGRHCSPLDLGWKPRGCNEPPPFGGGELMKQSSVVDGGDEESNIGLLRFWC